MYKTLLLILSVIVLNSSVSALDVDAQWTGTNWLDTDNWDTNEAPVDGADDATVSDGHTAVLAGSEIVDLDNLYVSGNSGSRVILAENADLEIESPSYLYVGLANGSGTFQVQDQALLDVPQAVVLAYGANSHGIFNMAGGTVDISTMTLGAYEGSLAELNINDGQMNVGYRVYMGSVGGTSSSPCVTKLNISGGEIEFNPQPTSTEYFMTGYNNSGYSVNTVNQTGGAVNVSYRMHLGDRNDNNVCIYSISNGSLTVNDRMANGYYWGSSYGRAASTFEVIGSNPVINVHNYYQNSQSKLKFVIDNEGISPINVAGQALFESQAMLEVEVQDNGYLKTNESFDVMVAGDITLQGSLNKSGSSQNCWDWSVVSEGGKDILRVTYKANVDSSSWQLFDDLILWLDASNISTLVSADGTLNDGDKLSGWNDVLIGDNGTANNALQLTTSDQPLWDANVEELGGKSAILFDGADSYFNISSLCINADATVFIVAENRIQNPNQSYHRPLLAADNDPYRTGGDGYGLGYTQQGTNKFMAYLSNGTSMEFLDTAISMDGDFRVYTVRNSSGTSSELFQLQNGETANVLKDSSPVYSRTTGFHTGYDIGAHSGSDPLYPRQYLGRIAEIIVFDRNLANSEMNSITDYLSEKYFHDLYAVKVDTLERVFPDQDPVELASYEPVDVPKGGKASFQYAVTASRNGVCDIDILPALNSNGQALDEFVTTYYLETVYVEANNNGCSATAAGTIPPTSWHSSFVRMAPFDVAEVLVPADYFDIDSGNYSAVLVDIEIPETAVSGEYTGYVQFYMDSEKVQLPYSIKVHDAVLPADPSIEFVHWLDAAPVNLTTDATVPNWWSEQHWLLLRKTGRVMYSMGERSMMTPLTEGAYPLIKTYHDDNDNYSYDYTGFDRWIEMFNDLGFALFEGTHANYMAPVFSWHITTNQRQTILASGGVDQARLDYLSDFWQSLYGHLCSKGWESMYVQHLMDEPYDVADYNDLHQCFINSMPGIKNIDAINSNISQYSPMVDIHVFNLISIAANQTLVNQRLAAGDGVWLYNCCSPYPPDYPNRHLDLKLTGNRLYPWLTYLYQAQGYLNWGANEYRGANPYTSSIGPLPDGTQNPGHPPGDNWFYYKSEAGLRASMRIIAFREGMQDRTLLQMLSENNSTEADNIMDDIARSATDWEDDPAAYYQARKDILDALDIYY